MKSVITFCSIVLLFSKNASAQFIHQVTDKDTVKEVLILSSEKQLSKELSLIGKVKAPDPIGFKKYDFKTQLDRIVIKTIEQGGNVLLINDIDPMRLTDMYYLKGRAYHTGMYEDFKQKTLERKRGTLAAKAKCTSLTLYRPAPTFHLNDLVKMEVLAGDMHYEIGPNTKIRLLYDTATNVLIKIKGTDSDTMINLHCGQETYVRCQVYPPNMTAVPLNTIAVPLGGYIRTIKIADPKLGELESKKIELTVD